MKYIIDYLKTANIALPMPLVWAVLAGHYGVHLLIVVVYIVDWLMHGGQRAELLELLRTIP